MIKFFIYEMPDLYEGQRHWWWNGYVAVPKCHPYYWINYTTADDELIDFTGFFVHWGLTFGSHLSRCPKELIQQYIDDCNWTPDDDMWIFGYDTMHSWDTNQEWSCWRILRHTAELAQAFQQCYDAPLAPNREQFNDSKEYYFKEVKSSCKSWLYYQLMNWLEGFRPSELMREVYLAKVKELYKLYVAHCNTLGVEPESEKEILGGKEINEILEQFNEVYAYTRFDPNEESEDA